MSSLVFMLFQTFDSDISSLCADYEEDIVIAAYNGKLYYISNYWPLLLLPVSLPHEAWRQVHVYIMIHKEWTQLKK